MNSYKVNYKDYDSVEFCITLSPKGHSDGNQSMVKIRMYKDRISYSMDSMRYEATSFSKDKYQKIRLLGSGKLAGCMFLAELRGEKGDMPQFNEDWMLWVYDRATEFDWYSEFDDDDVDMRMKGTNIVFRLSNLVFEEEMKMNWQKKYEAYRERQKNDE